mgnify:FL=1
MNKGTINCECGQEFYFETIRDFINCIHCGKQYEVKGTHIELTT